MRWRNNKSRPEETQHVTKAAGQKQSLEALEQFQLIAFKGYQADQLDICFGETLFVQHSRIQKSTPATTMFEGKSTVSSAVLVGGRWL